MVAAASPTGNSDAHCSLPSSSPVAPKPDDEDASGNSTLAQSVECCDRRDGDMLNQVLSNRSEEYRLLFRLPSEEVSGVRLLSSSSCDISVRLADGGLEEQFARIACDGLLVRNLPNRVLVVSQCPIILLLSVLVMLMGSCDAFRLVAESGQRVRTHRGGETEAMTMAVLGAGDGRSYRLMCFSLSFTAKISDSKKSFIVQRIIPLHQVTAVRKAKTVAIFPNAIEIFAGGKKYFFGSFLARDEAYGFIIDSCTQHGVDIKTMAVVDTKSEGSNQGNGSIIEKIQECNPLADDSSSSSRFKDANAKEELNPLLNGEVRDISLKPSKFKENECEENFNESSLEIPFIWIDEDIDAPTVPEGFTIVAESKFPLLVKEFFNLFVSNEALDFLRDFHSRCGDKDFQCTSWRKHELFGYTRNISFVHPVKVYLGPKFGNCQEVQKFRVYRNSHLVIETSQHVSDVPYGDYFEVEGFWDVVQDTSGENSCTVKVYSNVAFSKKTLFKVLSDVSTNQWLEAGNLRVPEVHVVTHGNYISDGSAYNVENVEWLEKRFNYLKEELVMMETRVERMRHEYALLRSHLQSLERLKFKKS
ncbi:hypothetical protein ZIOFF_056578 [Zingiber officinale]|uniref:VASt domain-containing protein n=1 Tax=Zingiber officinale TaxID=94328 RepID=A0A8J5FH40_ZINOF|nr:hypothetical protein ZIOFF_056578 [Zingiber officinale]